MEILRKERREGGKGGQYVHTPPLHTRSVQTYRPSIKKGTDGILESELQYTSQCILSDSS